MQTTFPRLMLKHAAGRPTAPALREKEYGISRWESVFIDLRLYILVLYAGKAFELL